MVHYGNTKTTKSNSEVKINKGRYKRNLKRQTGKKIDEIHRANLTSVGRISTSSYPKIKVKPNSET